MKMALLILRSLIYAIRHCTVESTLVFLIYANFIFSVCFKSLSDIFVCLVVFSCTNLCALRCWFLLNFDHSDLVL